MQSGDLKLLWDYFHKKNKEASLKKGVWRFEIAMGLFFGGKPLEKVFFSSKFAIFFEKSKKEKSDEI